MPYSYNDFPNVAGTQVVFPIVFTGESPGYIEEAHVFVEYDGVVQDQANRTFDTATQVRLISNPGAGVNIRIQRSTSIEEPLIDFEGGAQLSEKNLDKNTLQMLYLTQEAFDVGAATTDDVNIAVAAAQAAQAAAEVAQAASESARDDADADVVLTHADVASTNADVVLTNADVVTAEAAKTLAVSKAAEAVISADASEASYQNSLSIEADVITQGDTQVARVLAEGNTQDARIELEGDTQDARVITEGDTQVARLDALVDSAELNKSVRQTMLAGPDLEATPGTIETAATKTGDLRSTYHDLGMDMLTGSRGGMTITKNKTTALGSIIQASIFDNITDTLITSGTVAVGTVPNNLQQLLATGVQMGSSGTYLAATNLYAFQTTHKTVLDGVEWHYNPVSGFAMCKYVGTGVAFNLQHPMGKDPLFWAVKNTETAYDWRTGRQGTVNNMKLSLSDIEASSLIYWPTVATDTYIAISGNSNVNEADKSMFLFGWFGDPLDDLHVGIQGERGVTASWVYEGGSGLMAIDTGITDIQMVLWKGIDSVDDWHIMNKAAGWSLETLLNETDAESAEITTTVSGSAVNSASTTYDRLFVVVGSTADAPDNKLKAGTKVLRKVGTAASGHRVDLGSAASGGDNGMMVMGRAVGSAANNNIVDTITGPLKYLLSDSTGVLASDPNGVTGFTTTGFTLGSNVGLNKAELNQYTAFNTTHKVTTGDGLEWQYNPLTGFAMCKYTGTNVAGRTLTHPMGKKLRMGWWKGLNSVIDWCVYLDTTGATVHMLLNLTNAASASTTRFNDTEPNDTTITLGVSSQTNDPEEYIFYGWFGDDLSDIAEGLTGERGVSAFWKYTGGAGAMSVDTGIDHVTVVLYKTSGTTGAWGWFNVESGTTYTLNDTAVEAVEASVTVEGSTLIWPGGTYDREFIAFGSKADSGVDNDVILPSSVSEPTVVSMANGFGSQGNIDIVKQLIASQTLNITGAEGQKFIYVQEDGTLGWTAVRPEYLRGYVPYVKGNHVYDIDKVLMYNDSAVVAPLVFIGECWLDNLGNVYDIRTYVKGDVWVSNKFTSMVSTVRVDDNPFGQIEVLPQLIGIADKEFVSKELLEVDAETLTTTTDATPDASEYKINVRRNF